MRGIDVERYRAAVIDNPRLPEESFSAYLIRLAAAAEEAEARAATMRLPYREDSEYGAGRE